MFFFINNIFLPFIQILLLVVVYWITLRVFRHTRGIFTLMSLLAICGLIFMLNKWCKVPVFHALASAFYANLPLIVLILFQEELRRFLASPMVWVRRFTLLFRLKRRARKKREGLEYGIDEIVKAVCCLTTLPEWRNHLWEHYGLNREDERLSNVNTGALIAIEGIAGLEDFRERGVPLECEINYRLLRTIFYPGTPLHDGGIIVRAGRGGLNIIAAGCRFPGALFGAEGPVHTRQDAVHGMATMSDAFVLMVSEESGSVLMPAEDDRHRIKKISGPMELRRRLEEFLQARPEPRQTSPAETHSEERKGEK